MLWWWVASGEGLAEMTTLELKFERWEGGGHLRIWGERSKQEEGQLQRLWDGKRHGTSAGRKAGQYGWGNEGERRGRGFRGGRPAYEEAGKAFVFYSKYNGNMEGFNGSCDMTWLRLQKERSVWVLGGGHMLARREEGRIIKRLVWRWLGLYQ